MTDTELVDHIIETMIRYGRNCDRGTVGLYIGLVLENQKENDERLNAIKLLADPEYAPPSLQRELDVQEASCG
ncbi:hypothetical protein HBA55_29440 [Pseudomaricurvus alkylphenolicus]|uniref:hypothetical protein n=1 Tax=Pseudomaricurvus alkylphenolicus TaxID=1306991 RepID=UPI00141ECA41|nr:hypothetical protein [Pseudomaricurvus alkylphenolicus]NIB43762.1 hypothetical protein [Pseudomaricurvus alkylphenolicus]